MDVAMKSSTVNEAFDPELEGNEPQEEANPIDRILATIDSYIQDPSLVTAETLVGLKGELEAIKVDMDSTSMDEPVDYGPTDQDSFASRIRERVTGRGD